VTSYLPPSDARKLIAAKRDQTPVVATEDPDFGPPGFPRIDPTTLGGPGTGSGPMIATRPPTAMSFTPAPGYTGPLPPGGIGDYSTYIPSNRLSGPSLSIPGGRPGIGTGGVRTSFDVGGGIRGGIEGAQNPGDLPWWVSAGVGVITGGLGGSTGSGGSSGSTSSAALASEGTGSCPSGYERNSRGECVRQGVIGAIQDFVPGGQTGKLPQGQGAYGPAVMGAFGIPAIQPSQTGTVIAGDGTVRPTLGCPPGAVLGKDNLCYMKGSIPRKFRKWPPKPRPVMSAQDGKTLRKADRLKTKVKKLAQGAGFSCRKR